LGNQVIKINPLLSRDFSTLELFEELAGALNASFASAERVWEVGNARVEVRVPSAPAPLSM